MRNDERNIMKTKSNTSIIKISNESDITRLITRLSDVARLILD